MAHLHELTEELRNISAEQEFIDQKIEKIFEILELYCTLKKPRRSDVKNVTYTLVILASIVQKGLGTRVKIFLDQH